MFGPLLINVTEHLALQALLSLCLIIPATLESKSEDLKMDLEEFELELIDFDVEEVFEDEDGILIYAPFEQFGAIQKYLEENELEILSSGFERISTTTKKLT